MENKKVINGSLVILFLTLSVVYLLVYQKKESLFKSPIISGSEIINQTGVLNQSGGLDTKSSNSIGNIETSVSDVELSGFDNSDSPILVHVVSSNDGVIPGTSEYFGTLDIVDILGQKPKFILQDSKGNYFAYYGDNLDFKDTVETLGGNVYEMVTESEIIQNQLFGDKVSYINLSMFRDIWVIMVIEIDDEMWLLQIPANKYHYSKDYLKSLFIH